MNAPRHLSGRRSRRLSGVVLWLTAGITMLGSWPCPGQPPGSQVPAMPRLTRAELMKKWDLNGDGSIDAGEVEVASSKMRLERAKLRLQTGLDPVTGKPREDLTETADDPDETAESRPLTVDELAAKLGFEPLEPQDEPPLKPKTQPRFFGLPPGRDRAAIMPGGIDATTGRSSSVVGPPPIGGVRAGGLAAQPGYGSGFAAPSLNAGRADAATASGGILPRQRPPEAARNPPPSSIAPRPRRTVEDFDVYR
jgi:hypothetical protein